MNRIDPKKLAALIARSKLNKRQVGEISGVGEETLRNALYGRRSYQKHITIEAIAEALGCEASDLIAAS